MSLLKRFNELDALIVSLPDSPRKAAAVAVRDWLSDWTRCGEAFARIMDNADYVAWGYKSFEDWVDGDLHIAKAWAHKAVKGYRFLAGRYPEFIGMTHALPAAPTVAALAEVADAEGAHAIAVKVLTGELVGADAKSAIRSLRAPKSMDAEETERMDNVRKTAKRLLSLIGGWEYLDDELHQRAVLTLNALLKAVTPDALI